MDWEGNRSPDVPVNFYFARSAPLELEITGKGTVAGVTNGQVLNAGSSYTATATPSKGYVLDNWSGSATGAVATISFQVPTTATNFSLKASFISDPLPTLTGTYNGLFQTLGNPSFEGSGFMALSLKSGGDFDGSIQYHGQPYFFNGKFDSAGNAGLQGLLDGVNFSMSLQLQRSTPAGLITGTMSATGSSIFVQLERLAPGMAGVTNAPPTGPYTFALPVVITNSPNPTVPGGNGYGTATISSAGVLSLDGVLGDGTTITAAPKVSRLGRWPLYVPLGGNKGAISGWISQATNQPGKLQGSMQWVRLSDASSGGLYPAGVTNQASFVGSSYNPAPDGTRLLSWVYGLARIAGSDLVPPLTNQVKLTTNNTFEISAPNPNLLQLQLDPASGLVNGSFVNPWFGTTNIIESAAVVASNYIRGQYRSGTQIGSFSVDISPVMVTQSVTSVTLAGLTAAMLEGGVIQFEGDGVISLTNALKPQYNTRFESKGHSVVISGAGTSRLVEVPPNVSFAAVGMIFADGYYRGDDGVTGPAPTAGGDAFGAGIFSLGTEVGLTNCIITNCIAHGGQAGQDTSTNGAPVGGGKAMGAAIYNSSGNLSLSNCTVVGSQALAGGNRSLANTNQLSSGDAAAMGGAVFSGAGICRILGSSFRDNRVRGGEALPLSSEQPGRTGDAAGGAIAVSGGTLFLSTSSCLSNTVSQSTNSAKVPGGAYAGAIFVETNVVALIDESVFGANAASAGTSTNGTAVPNAEGGAIYSIGALTLSNCTFEFNMVRGGSTPPGGPARGGALSALGFLAINGSTFNDNVAQGGQHEGVPASPVAGGNATGGAIFAFGSTVAITNATFAFNHARGGSGTGPDAQTLGLRGNGLGGAVAVNSNAVLLAHVTLAYNEALVGEAGTNSSGTALGGGVANIYSTVFIRGSILATNNPANVSGQISDQGYNILSDGSIALTGAGSLTNTEALLGSLSANGGSTRTFSIFPDSPARDAVRGGFPPIDQRGTGRPQGSYADSGSFEFVQVIPVFSIQPSGTNVARFGTNITFQSLASGPGPIGYFWLKDDGVLTGAVSNYLTLTNLQVEDAGTYAAVATNSYGSSTSSIVTLALDLRPYILTQPADIVIAPGASTTMVVTASGPALGYRWLHNHLPVTDATNSTFQFSNAAPGIDGPYQVIITNSAGSVTSRVASVSWSAAALAILNQPQDLTVAIGSPSTLTVLASGIAPIHYQWWRNSAPITGATNNFVSYSYTARTNGGNYWVVVDNPFVGLNSRTAAVAVVASPLVAIRAQGNSTVSVTAFGDPGRVHRLLTSTNLAAGSSWDLVGSQVIPGSGSVTWNLQFSTNAQPAFYRAVTP